MLADLVEVMTTYGITLSGAYFVPVSHDSALPVEALAFLTANRRGHDLVANGTQEGPLAGYVFETVDESRVDYAAWLSWSESEVTGASP